MKLADLILHLMANPDMNDFVEKGSRATREALEAGISHREIAECFITMAGREFGHSSELQREYENFIEFAVDNEFERQEMDERIRDTLDRVEDYLDESDR